MMQEYRVILVAGTAKTVTQPFFDELRERMQDPDRRWTPFGPEGAGYWITPAHVVCIELVSPQQRPPAPSARRIPS